MKLDHMLTLQLRPHIAAMLDAYVQMVRERLPPNVRGKVSASLIIRKMLPRDVKPETLAYVDVGRKRDGAAVQVRVRCTASEFEAVNERGIPYAKLIAAQIVEASHPDGNYPANPDSQTSLTKDTTP